MSNEKEMPRYRCHKEVHALQILEIMSEDDHLNMKKRCFLVPVEEGYAPVVVTEEWMAKHQPQAGGYYVVYSDGYTSYSPKQAFEEGYSKDDRYADPFDLGAHLPPYVQERMVRKVYPILPYTRPIPEHSIVAVIVGLSSGTTSSSGEFNLAIESWANNRGISL